MSIGKRYQAYSKKMSRKRQRKVVSMETLRWGNDRLQLVLGWSNTMAVHLERIACGTVDLSFNKNIPIVEILASGHGHWEADDRLIHTTIGASMRYRSHRQWHDDGCNFLAITEEDGATHLSATINFQLPDTGTMFRITINVSNHGEKPLYLESVTSWASLFGSPSGIKPDLGTWNLWQENQDWLAEGRWKRKSLRSLLPQISQNLTGHDPRGEYAVISSGTWSTGHHVPLTIIESPRFHAVWVAQIEHNGAWRWEIGDCTRDGYMALSGPTAINHTWTKKLEPGAHFISVPASIEVADTFDHAVAALTQYRRVMNASCGEIKHPHIIFNDYMNTINGDPTTAKLLPLVRSAAKVGCDVYVMDCGWYDDSGDWWSSVGEWKASRKRFPNGLEEVTNEIRRLGMIPGLWLEPEVIGVDSPIAHVLPDQAFFQRNGERVVEQDRYILDFSNSKARNYINSVIDRLIKLYHIGYFKFDYNLSPGTGTDQGNVMPGEGLLRHNRAYSSWIESLHRRYPKLILENCSSGGMREDFAQSSRFDVQSTSDQQNFILYPPVAAAAPLMVLPEQAANWGYPQADMDYEENAFTLVTTMMGRFFLSGYLNRMNQNQFGLCQEAIQAYRKNILPLLPQSVPFWPIGLPDWDDSIVALGLRAKRAAIIGIWARHNMSAKTIRIRVPGLQRSRTVSRTIFPLSSPFKKWHSIQGDDGQIFVTIPVCSAQARIFLVQEKY